MPPDLFHYLKKYPDKSKVSSDHSFRDELHLDIFVGVTILDHWKNDFQKGISMLLCQKNTSNGENASP
ncbi:MAG: hypothetical protein AB2693_17595 [Candidatus Thiodiazotropha sp.]